MLTLLGLKTRVPSFVDVGCKRTWEEFTSEIKNEDQRTWKSLNKKLEIKIKKHFS